MNDSSSYIDSVGDSNAPETTPPARPGRYLRLRGGLIAAPAWAVLITGALLTPMSRRSGTHEQLGLPPCDFMASTGWPCPACGMTTSVSAMMHGQFELAARAHPFGVLLAAALAAVAVLGTLELITGRNVLRWLRPGGWMIWTVIIGLPLGWGLRILIGLLDGTLPPVR